jgi:hypothetical protein
MPIALQVLADSPNGCTVPMMLVAYGGAIVALQPEPWSGTFSGPAPLGSACRVICVRSCRPGALTRIESGQREALESAPACSTGADAYQRPAIGIGGSLTAPPLPHHRAYGSERGQGTTIITTTVILRVALSRGSATATAAEEVAPRRS